MNADTNNIISDHPDQVLSAQVMQFLDGVEDETKTGKFYHEMGVDTEFVQGIKSLLKDPIGAIDTIAERGSKAFIAVFWQAVKGSGLNKYIDAFVADISGTKASLWIYLKSEDYNYENRAKLYDLRAQLANSVPLFRKTDIDLMILEEGEVEYPTSFTSITLS